MEGGHWTCGRGRFRDRAVRCRHRRWKAFPGGLLQKKTISMRETNSSIAIAEVKGGPRFWDRSIKDKKGRLYAATIGEYRHSPDFSVTVWVYTHSSYHTAAALKKRESLFPWNALIFSCFMTFNKTTTYSPVFHFQLDTRCFFYLPSQEREAGVVRQWICMGEWKGKSLADSKEKKGAENFQGPYSYALGKKLDMCSDVGLGLQQGLPLGCALFVLL